MATPGDAQAASEGLTEDQAIGAFEDLLTRIEGDSEGDETQEPEESGAEADPEDDAEESAEDDGEEQSETDEDPDEDDEPPPVFAVKVDGKEVKVPLPELLKGYSREQDYTRKTMAHAENVKAFEAEKAGLSEERGQYKAVLDVWAEQLKALNEPNEELEALRHSDPGEYAARMTDKAEREKQIATIAAEKQRVDQAELQEQAKRTQLTLHEEAEKLFKAIPAWADPVKGDARAKADKAKMRDYAVSLGYTPQEVAAISDHRQMVVLRDAAAYRALKAKEPQVQRQADAVKVARPGTSASRPNRATEIERAKQRLKATGSDRDAEAAFMKLLR